MALSCAVLGLTPPSSSALSPAGVLDEVPFYLYEPERFSAWAHCTHGVYPGRKHAGALFFINALRKSSLRTRDISLARVAVVPALLDWMAVGLCITGGRQEEHIANMTAEILPTFNTTTHLVWAQNFATTKVVQAVWQAFPKMVFARYLVEQASSPMPCSIHVGFTTDYDTQASAHLLSRCSRIV